jgi:3-hydroxybutyryl-CoA dehydratase
LEILPLSLQKKISKGESKMPVAFGQVPIEEIIVGMEISYSQTITDADVKSFAGISGDRNPIHMSDEYANESRFKKRMAHGLMSASFFSALFGTKIPGPGCVYVSQSLQFKRPVYLGDTVTATVTVKAVDIPKRRVLFKTVCTVKKRVVIDGEAELYIPQER